MKEHTFNVLITMDFSRLNEYLNVYKWQAISTNASKLIHISDLSSELTLSILHKTNTVEESPIFQILDFDLQK